MITASKIIDELNRRLVEVFPDIKTVYLDTCPFDFERPSLFIECTGTLQVDATCATILETHTITINAFPVVDDHGCAGEAQLPLMRQGILGIFRQGFLRVEDRAVGVTVIEAGGDTDFAYVTIEVQYFEDRSDEPDTTPPMETVETAISAA